MVCVALETRLDVSADVDAARWVCRVAEMWVREEEEEAEGEEGGLSAKDNHTAVSSELVSRSVTLDVDKGCKFAGCQDCADRLGMSVDTGDSGCCLPGHISNSQQGRGRRLLAMLQCLWLHQLRRT